MRYHNEMMLNAPRTYAWHIAYDDNIFDFSREELGDIYEAHLNIALGYRDWVFSPKANNRMLSAYADCRRHGWGTKKAYKIASGHWNNSNHSNIEPDWELLT